ncbi:flagellar motor protein MotB [Pseudomonas sp. B392_1p]|uniref:flagellar motor protein MotB n=1 Tax=Pseudomonas sp. B392_1p TaxID=3457507 RepID=UPI003FD531B0
MENSQPIIIKRVKRYASNTHGGSWKIAFADFMTAMMAFFLVLWLLSTATPLQRAIISGYFKDPVGFTETASPHVIDLGGTPTPAPERTQNIEQDGVMSEAQPQVVSTEEISTLSALLEFERMEMLRIELQNKIEESPELQRFKDQVLIESTRDGLRIQIMDAENRPMFDLSSARMQPYFEDILLAMADTLALVPNKLSISGHTDARQYSSKDFAGNWELSTMRANAARRALVAGSYPEEQVAQVVGYASSALFDRADPFSPMNRRIDIVVLTRKAQQALEGEPNNAWGRDAERPAQEDPLPAEEVRERLNLFRDGPLQMDELKQQ